MDLKINKKQRGGNFLVIASAVLFLDQAFKFAALRSLYGFQLNKNYNSLLGLGANLYLILLFFLIIFIYFKKSSLQKSDGAVKFAAALALGGVISNSVDMFFYRYIIDYIAISAIFSFNISDLAICAGALILGWKVFKK